MEKHNLRHNLYDEQWQTTILGSSMGRKTDKDWEDMQPVMYSHRLKSVLQHTVRELGLTVSLTDENATVSLAENEAMIRETAGMLGIQLSVEHGENGTYMTFFP